MYVLQDNAFRWMRNLHAIGPTEEAGNAAVREYAASYTHFPCGVIRGVLVNLGLSCASVTGDAGSLPGWGAAQGAHRSRPRGFERCLVSN